MMLLWLLPLPQSTDDGGVDAQLDVVVVVAVKRAAEYIYTGTSSCRNKCQFDIEIMSSHSS